MLQVESEVAKEADDDDDDDDDDDVEDLDAEHNDIFEEVEVYLHTINVCIAVVPIALCKCPNCGRL
jgi:hypothetical protein